jgi:hypothetical protein
MAEKATAKALDFTQVKERGPVAPIHQMAGDYAGKVMSVTDITMGETKRPAWLFIIKVNQGTYALRCGFNDNELWKIRNLFVACGIAVPKKRLKVDPARVVTRGLAVTLQDHEYDGKLSSEVVATFPLSELEGASTDDEEIDDEDEEEEEEEVVAPQVEEDEEEEEEEEPPPSAKKKKAPVVVVEEEDDDELEALDIEDL